MSRRTILMLAGALCLISPASFAETVHYRATLDTASEVPPKTGPGKGTLQASLDTTTRKLDYTVDYSGLSGPATAAHFHGPAAKGANAGVAVPLQPTASPIKGSATLTEQQVTELNNGMMYVNVHTATNPGGEIRGQVEKGN
jgi:hypothetical protein